MGEAHMMVNYTYIDPGSGGWRPRAGRCTARVTFEVGGQITDEIEVTGVAGGGTYSGVAGNMAGSAGRCGEYTGYFIRDSAIGQPK